MKSLRLTKQTQNKIFEKFSRISVKLFVVFALFLMPTFSLAASLDDRINQTEQNLSQTKSTKKTLSGEVAAFDAQIGGIQSQINATDADLTKTQNEITSTNNQIKQAELDLAKTKDQLREYIRTMYEEGQVSNIELIAKSKNFSEFVDRNEYMVTMQLKIKGTSDKIVALKTELELKKKVLEEKRAKIEQLRKDQALQRSALGTQRAGKNAFLQKTKGDEKYFQNTLGDLYAQKAALSVQNNEVVSGGSSGYPYGNPPPSSMLCDAHCTADAYGYYIGECTSYAAWWRSSHGRPIPRNLGNAGSWGSIANGTTPTAGSVMVFPVQRGMPYGHVAIVESVNGNGTVNISEYNWSPHSLTRRTVNQYDYYRVVFIH